MQPAPITTARPEGALFDRANRGDRDAFDQLVRYFMPMAKRIARSTNTRLVESEDLEQVSCLALVLAVRRFDPGRGLAFSTFAVPTIRGEIKRHLRDRGWSVRVPRILQETGLKVQKATAHYYALHGRAPTAKELAALVGEPLELVLEAIEANDALGSVSLDAGSSDGDDEAGPLIDRLGADDPGFAATIEMASLSASVRKLPPRDRLVLHLRFVEDKTQSDIAAAIGTSQMHVSRILRAALQRLRELEGAPRQEVRIGGDG